MSFSKECLRRLEGGNLRGLCQAEEAWGTAVFLVQLECEVQVDVVCDTNT